MKRCRIAIQVGTHSPWVSRLLKSMGRDVIVANARQVPLITPGEHPPRSGGVFKLASEWYTIRQTRAEW